MRAISLLAILLLAFAAAPAAATAQQHSQWQTVRSEADGFSIEMPGAPKTSTLDIGNGATQDNFVIESGQETYLMSVINLGKGNGPVNPGEQYFAMLVKAYADGSKTTLRSSRMITWGGHPGMEAIADADGGAVHLINVTASGDRVYLAVFGGPKALENSAQATHMRDTFKLFGG